MSLESTFQDLLPSKSARAAFAITVFLAAVPFFVPASWLPELQLPSEGQLGLLKVAVCLVFTLIGTVVTLLLVLRHYTHGKGQEEIADRVLKVRADKNRQLLMQKAFFQKITK